MIAPVVLVSGTMRQLYRSAESYIKGLYPLCLPQADTDWIRRNYLLPSYIKPAL